MLLKEKKGLTWLEFELLQPYLEIKHGVFLKHEEGALDEGYQQKVKESLNINSIATGKQSHGDCVIEILSQDQENETSADGLFTSLTKVGLGIFHADCQAVMFYDPYKKIIANVHCGWRGNRQNILGKAVELLKQKGSSPKDLLVCISPSLGPQKSEFIYYEQEWPPSFHQYQFKPFHFDLWKMSQDQLQASGIIQDNIEIAKICTYTDHTNFYSYRRDKTAKRNNLTLIALL